MRPLVLLVGLSLFSVAASAATCDWSMNKDANSVYSGTVEAVRFGAAVRIGSPNGVAVNHEITLESVRTGIDSSAESIAVRNAQGPVSCEQRNVFLENAYRGVQSACADGFSVRCIF